MTVKDRAQELRKSGSLTGIDFVQVLPSQLELYIFLQHDILPSGLLAALAALQAENFVIEATDSALPSRVTVVQHLTPIPMRDGRHALHLLVVQPGGFGAYRLRIQSGAIDPYYNNIEFSFKANCPSELDCADEKCCCASEDSVDYPVDYRGRDFWSLRQSLIDFASQRYPDWQDRLEADFGMVVAELLAALGDEFSYAQDRIAREFTLETATQRRSLRHLARLVDYQLDDGSAATTWIDVTVSDNISYNTPVKIKSGTAICDANQQIFFEIGRGLRDLRVMPPVTDYTVVRERNLLLPYRWDANEVCLPAGSTQLTLAGHHAAVLQNDASIDPAGRWILLATLPTDPAQPERRVLARIVDARDDIDPLLSVPVTRIRWDNPTPVELDLLALVLRGNLLPATSGKTQQLRFRVGTKGNAGDPDMQAIERIGINSSLAYPHATQIASDQERVKYLCPLTGSEITPLAWLEHRGVMEPEVYLERDGDNDNPWLWMPSLVGEDSAKPLSKVYTLEDGVFRRVAGYERFGKLTELVDYASGDGKTLRFGDSEFGLAPPEGSRFTLRYRLGNGRLMNVAADTLIRLEVAQPAIAAITNPLAATGGRDPESAQSIRTNAPEAYQAVAFRAVKPEDYREIAERLPWVQRAGASVRWTGSWPTVFVTPDPHDAVSVSAAREQELEQLLDRVRLAGRQAKMMAPRYADISLRITVCVEADAYRGQVKERVLEALFGAGCDSARQKRGFFDEDNFTFGTALTRAGLIAAIQAVHGVRAVEEMQVCRRGWFDWRDFTEFALPVGMNEMVRVSSNRALPERGAVQLTMEGGL